MKKIVPVKDSDKSKKIQVGEMFDDISPRYDLLNRVLSGGIDIIWRKRVVAELKKHQPKSILDIATGTADLAIAESVLNSVEIVGVDISEGMLNIGREKIKKLKLEKYIRLEYGDSENLTFEDNSFDAITVAFGVRNFENLEKGLSEIYRVCKENGCAIVLEFSQPEKFPFKNIYRFYFNYILPTLGKLVSKNENAYNYLPESVYSFPYGEEFAQKMKSAGFQRVTIYPQTFGVCTMYVGIK